VNRLLAIALVMLAAWQTAPAATNPPPVKTRVVLARDPTAVTGLQADAGKTRALVSAGIRALTGRTSDADAWQQFAGPRDVVGIKISTLAVPLHVTHREVVNAIADGLAAAGVAPTNIIVWDRDPNRMREGGWPPGPATSKQPYRVVSVIGEDGWDAAAAYESKIVGKLIWGDLEFGRDEALDTYSHLPKLLTQTVTKLINVPVLMDHDPCGLAGCLYNVSLGGVDNARRFEQPTLRGSPAIEEINLMLARSHRAPVLHVLDALVAGYAGGPSFKPHFSWPYGGLYFSRDPVAVDALALELLEAKRKTADVPAIGANAAHVANAARLGLGQSDRANMDLIEVAP
jgi:uncharacterized protein (DUF362 family)